MPKSMNFLSDADLKAKIHRWWGSLEFHRKDRSELSRATEIADVYHSDAFYRLKRMLDQAEYKVFDPALARVAGVLALIRRDRDGESFGILLSQKMDFSQVKFLERVNDDDRLYRKFRHLVMHLKGEAPVMGVADTLYWWDVRKPNREFFYQFFAREGA